MLFDRSFSLLHTLDGLVHIFEIASCFIKESSDRFDVLRKLTAEVRSIIDHYLKRGRLALVLRLQISRRGNSSVHSSISTMYKRRLHGMLADTLSLKVFWCDAMI